MAARLKVFVTSDGLTDYVVAASSRPKALAAWGVRQDLFKEGQAHETDDPALADAARAQPETVLRRPVGSRAVLAKAPARKPARPRAPSKALLNKLAALEARLEALDAAHQTALARLDAERTELESRALREARNFEAQRAGLAADLGKARKAVQSAS